MLLSLLTFVNAQSCQDPKTLWDKHYCQKLDPKYQQVCHPIKAVPSGQIKGAIILYHGFSACPDAFNEIIQSLNQAGFAAYSPLYPGHGLVRGYGCDVPGTCLSNNTNPSELPSTKEPYMEFTSWSLEMLKEEVSFLKDKSPDFYIGTLGLSLGGSVAMYAGSLPNTPISRVLVANPFYSITVNYLDFLLQNCKASSNPEQCIVSLFPEPEKTTSALGQAMAVNNGTIGNAPPEWILEAASNLSEQFKKLLKENTLGKLILNSYDFFVSALADTLSKIDATSNNGPWNNEIGWGQRCLGQVGRGGFCYFRVKNLVAAQSFSEVAAGLVQKFPQNSVYANIHSDIDGPSRDSVAYQVYERLAKRNIKVSRCVFGLKCSLKELIDQKNLISNVCGAPHSLFSAAEARTSEPYQMYWKPSLFDTILNFFNKADNIGVSSGDYMQCVSKSDPVTKDPVFVKVGVNFVDQAVKFAQTVKLP